MKGQTGFIDSVGVFVKSGNGGKGCDSYYRDKYTRHRIPDGGDGGDGGNIIVQASRHLRTLLDFRFKKHFKAESGKIGSSKNKTGAKGADCIIKVPCGTQILDADLKLLLRDLKEHSEKVIVAKGGKGAKGSRKGVPVPEPAQGEEKQLRFELKLIADAGIVGFPNAGKSSLVSKISTAKTKIADYPFTTKVPRLGLVRFGEKSFTIADMPGLIEGASKGRGLGDKFLRHIERTSILIFLLDGQSYEQDDLFAAYQILQNELLSYSCELSKKTTVMAVNKMDIPGAEERLFLFKKKIKTKIFPISCADGRGVKALVKHLAELLCKDAD